MFLECRRSFKSFKCAGFIKVNSRISSFAMISSGDINC